MEHPVTVPLARIVVDERYQVRKKGTDPGTVQRYASVLRSGRELPPVTLALINGVYVCVDGFHRIAAHRKAGRLEVQAVIITTANEREAQWLAAEANLSHGLPLKSGEVREAFRRYVKAAHHRKGSARFKSYREVADDLGGLKSHTTIRNWMMKDFPAVARQLGGAEGHADHRAPRGVAQGTPLERARAALDTARNYAAGVTDPHDRETLGAEVAAVLAELQASEAWKPQEEPPF